MNRQASKKNGTVAPDNAFQKTRKAIKRILGFLLVTLLLIAVGLYGVMWVLMKGPSPTARKLFTLSVRETSAVGFLANLYLSDEEIAEIVDGASEQNSGETTDSTLITIGKTGRDTDAAASSGGTADSVSQGDINPDEGIEIEEVKGSAYQGVMMIIDDPSRIFVGTPASFGEGSRGLTLSEMIEGSGAVGGINAGGFYDPGGGGNGGIPDGIVICSGKLAWGGSGSDYSVIGFDADGILHVGTMTAQEALDEGIQWAVSFGPTLIVNGTPCGGMSSGVNPRTAIGQRSDGAVLMLVIDGRQVGSLGATFDDLADIMLDYGAVNAANLDGGSSTLMIYKGEALNECASVYGPRKIATSFLIK